MLEYCYFKTNFNIDQCQQAVFLEDLKSFTGKFYQLILGLRNTGKFPFISVDTKFDYKQRFNRSWVIELSVNDNGLIAELRTGKISTERRRLLNLGIFSSNYRSLIAST